MNVTDFKKYKTNNKKITILTCYDYSFAKIISQTDVDCILVGDSLSMTMHGLEDTTYADLDLMALHTSAVKRGLSKDKFLISDLPFLSYRGSLDRLIDATSKLIKNGAQAVKLEGSDGNIDFIKHIVESGIPVMGHIGLTPQFVNIFGGYKVQGKTESQADVIYEQAHKLQKAGCFSIVLECIPSALGKKISKSLDIPTIGIGAGPSTDGQVLVIQDMLGMNSDFSPKFAKKYISGISLITNAVNEYCTEVKDASFPDDKHSF
ncbi:MAG: 3-methyl-2-oxobutanoate hydroxymethyltransferase [Francisellaceae bacterium]|jgi:3-methyl-2-oxobutanoate hydroxymethyltransferase